MASPILVTGAAGRVGAVGRTVTELLLKQGKAVRAMVRNEDERAQALRDMGAEVVVGDLLDLDSMHRKGGAYLERLASVNTVVFDKTGTLTQGRPTVVDVVAFDGDAGAVLEAAAALEQRSEHALADAVVGACRARGVTPAAPETFEAVTGRG